LFAGAVSQVPVTDMLRYHKFTVGHFWESEYGNADKDGAFDYIIKYSPLHNIRKQRYPAMLVSTADHDDRVVPLHTYKYVAQLQYTAGNSQDIDRPILARIQTNQGHGGGKPTKMMI